MRFPATTKLLPCPPSPRNNNINNNGNGRIVTEEDRHCHRWTACAVVQQQLRHSRLAAAAVAVAVFCRHPLQSAAPQPSHISREHREACNEIRDPLATTAVPFGASEAQTDTKSTKVSRAKRKNCSSGGSPATNPEAAGRPPPSLPEPWTLPTTMTSLSFCRLGRPMAADCLPRPPPNQPKPPGYC